MVSIPEGRRLPSGSRMWMGRREKKEMGGQREKERAPGGRSRAQPGEVCEGRKGNTHLSPTLLISSQMEAGVSQNGFLMFSRIA